MAKKSRRKYLLGDYILSNDLERLKNEKDITISKLYESLEKRGNIEEHLTQVHDEYSRVVKLSGQAGYVIDKIDKDFKDKTKLTNNDIVLLFLCTAIQCVRQYLLSNDTLRFKDEVDDNGKVKTRSNQKGDEFMQNTIGKITKPEWEKVLLQTVPYDIIHNSKHVSDIGLGGTTHRYRVLGHDPVLGWIFGTANIMTNSLTKHNFETFQVSVERNEIIRHYPNGCIGMLNKACQYAANDKKLLAASVARQAIHFGSDMFTKQGLPLPFVSTLKNNLAKDMITKWNIDTWSFIKGSGLYIFINYLIFCIHQLFYNEEKDGSRDYYEVRTRKILSYSNVISTGSNILVSALSQNGKLLDLGGMTVTLHRLISDYKFIHKIKQEFLEKEFYNRVLGSEYDFVKEN